MKRLSLLLAIVVPGLAQPVATPLTLEQAVDRALTLSKASQIAQLKVSESSSAADAARRMRYPQISALGVGAYLQHPADVKIDQGSLTPALNEIGLQLGMSDVTSALGQFPASSITLAKGSSTPLVGTLTIAQPLTQLWRINNGVQAADAGLLQSRREARRVANELRFVVEQLYIGIIVENHRIAEHEARLACRSRRLRDAENAHRAGEILDEAELALRAAELQSRTELTQSRQRKNALVLQLADLIGQPGETELSLTDLLPRREERTLQEWTAESKNNPDRQIAAAVVDKSASGLGAARNARIPELSLIASGYAQDGLPLLPRRSAAIGLTLNWDIFDFGRKASAINQALAQHRAAELNRDRIEEEATRQIRLAHQESINAKEIVALARQTLAYRQRAAELSRQNALNGLTLEATALEAEADLKKAQADLKAAEAQQHLALLRLHYLAGTLP